MKQETDKLDDRLEKCEEKIKEIELWIKGWRRIGNIIVVIFLGVLPAGFILKLFDTEKRITQSEERITTSEEKYKKIEEDFKELKDLESKLLSTKPSPSNSKLSSIVYKNGKLTTGYGLGVNSKSGNTQWVTAKDNAQCMAYPGGTNDEWGAVSITVGEPSSIRKGLGQDFSSYKTLSIEIKGEQGNESIYLGLRDENLQDNQEGDIYPIKGIKNDWKSYDIPLQDDFPSTNFSNLYTVTSFIFKGAKPQTVCFRNVQYNK